MNEKRRKRRGERREEKRREEKRREEVTYSKRGFGRRFGSLEQVGRSRRHTDWLSYIINKLKWREKGRGGRKEGREVREEDADSRRRERESGWILC